MSRVSSSQPGWFGLFSWMNETLKTGFPKKKSSIPSTILGGYVSFK